MSQSPRGPGRGPPIERRGRRRRSRAGRRRGVVGLVAAMAAWGVFWGAWAALLPAIKAQVGASEADLGLALLAIAAGALPALVLAGRLLDRFGGRALVTALAAFGVAAALPALAQSLPVLALALLVLGLASGALDVALNWGLATLEARQGRRVFNAAHAAFPLAVVVSAPAAGLAREQALSPAAILATAGAITLLTIPLNVVHCGTRGTAPAAAPRVRPSRSLLRLGVLAAVVLLVENAVEQWSSLHLEEGLDAAPAVAALGPAVYFATLFVGRVGAQAAGDRAAGPGAVVAAGLAAAVGLSLVAASATPAVALAGFAFAGLGMAAAVPALLSAAGASAAGGSRGAAVSNVTAISYAGYLASPPLVGAVAGLAGLRAAWWLLALVGLAMAVTVLAAPGARGGP